MSCVSWSSAPAAYLCERATHTATCHTIIVLHRGHVLRISQCGHVLLILILQYMYVLLLRVLQPGHG